MSACTIPNLFGFKKWFSARFESACEWHDARYVARDCWKIQADYGVSVMIAKRAWYYFPLAVMVFLFLTVAPVSYFMWYTE